MKTTTFLCLFVLVTGIVTAQDNPKVDEIFAEWDKRDSPGVALGVIHNGKMLYKRGYGMADLEHDIPNTPTSVFDIGSVSKQFTAMSILLLSKQGKLSLDDDIRKHLPELRDYGKTITIRHLLHHTSGLRDYLTLMDLAGLREENEYSEEEIVDLIARQKALNFDPGEEYLYSNSGYFLLSQIAKRASGKTLRQVAEELIFQPLGMKSTHFHDDFTMIVKNRAMGYSTREEEGFQLNMSWFDVTGDGAVFTTVEDLYLWDENFYNNKLGGGGQQLIEEMLTVGVLNNGKKLDYALALSPGKYRGLATVSHGGAWVGYRAQVLRFPEQKFTVICLANLASINPTSLARKVADVYLEGSFQDSEKKARQENALSLPEAELRKRAGAYRNPETGSIWKLEPEDGKLKVTASEGYEFSIEPVSATEFQASRWDLTAIFEDDGTLKITEAEETPYRYVPATLVKPTADELRALTGKYYSDEIGVTYSLALEGNSLQVTIDRNPRKTPLEPTVVDEFNLDGTILRVHREKDQVTGFTLNAGRVKNIEFQRNSILRQ